MLPKNTQDKSKDKPKAFILTTATQPGAANTLYLYGDVWDAENYGELVMQIDQLAAGTTLVMRINSLGGDVYAGWGLVQALLRARSRSVTIDAYIDGVAASMATAIMMTASKVTAASNAQVLIHEARGLVWGTETEMLQSAAELKSINTGLLALYVAKTGKTEAEIQALMTQDRWLNAQESLTWKLIDAIADPVLPQMQITQALAARAVDGSKRPQAYAAFPKSNKPQNMEYTITDWQVVAVALRLHPSAISPQTVLAAVTELQAQAGRVATLEAELNKLMEERSKENKVRAQALVDSAVLARKITPATQESWLAMANNDFENTTKALAAMPPLQSLVAASNADPGTATTPQNRESWDWDTWRKEDPKGLETLEKTDPVAFNKLYNAKFKQ